MNRRIPTLNQLVTWSVPFLLILLLIQADPQIITLVRNHLISSTPKVTKKIPSSKHAVKIVHHVVEHSPSRVVASTTTTTTTPTATTTSVPASSSGTASTEKLSESYSAPNGGTGTLSGTLSPPYGTVYVVVAANTKWAVTGDGPLNWQLTCAGVLVSSNATPILVAPGASDCVVTITSQQTPTVQWTLNSEN